VEGLVTSYSGTTLVIDADTVGGSGTFASWNINVAGNVGATGAGTVTSVTGTAPISVATGTTTPAITLGTVPVANGGTGATTLTGYLSGNGTSAVTASTTIPGTSISGNISGNAANVTGTVPVANGGTGATTLTGYLSGNGTNAVTASATIPSTAVTGAIPAAQLPNGITNFNTALQTQVTVASTPFYIAGSNLKIPATLYNGYKVGTTFRWQVAIQKNAAGTGDAYVLIYAGTTGTTADTAEADQEVAVGISAVADTGTLDVLATITSIAGTTATVYYAIAPEHHLATTGWEFTTGGNFTGTFTFSTSTPSMIFGLGFEITAGGTMPTVTIPLVEAHAYNLD
jgi:hypothetical protein